ncbi:hypothetical protein ACFOU0_04505 [Salinicoccus sesuvii]|uniref:Lipoprotein n=1 Tax=Salinicoccus sesuvii TaxID=868281 RepID=A0ABV7N5I2_9STAP
MGKKLTGVSTIVLTTMFLTGCSNPFDTMANGINELFALERDDTEDAADSSVPSSPDVSETVEDTEAGLSEETSEESDTDTSEVETLDYSHLMNEGEPVTLGEGTFVVGEDIQRGRYRATSTEGYGNLFVYDADERLSVSATMIEASDSNRSRSSEVVLFLDEGDEVEISGIDDVEFVPYETTEVSELTPGQWVVGEDFPAGIYDISLQETETLGYLKVNTIKDYETSRFALGSSAYGGTTEFTTAFEAGEVVTVEWVPKVVLTKR